MLKENSSTVNGFADSPANKFGLVSENLTLLGSCWMSNERLRFIQEPVRDRIMPARFSILGSLVYFGIAGSFCFGWWWLWNHFGGKPLGVSGWIVVVVAMTLATLGPIALSFWRIRHLKSISPLVEYDRKLDRVTLLGGQHSFAADQVVCLLLLTARSHSELHSEFHLLADVEDLPRRYLIMTDYGVGCSVFRKAASQFATRARLPLLQARPENLWKPRGEVHIEQLVAGR